MSRGTITANRTPAASRPPRWITRNPALRRALCASGARVTRRSPSGPPEAPRFEDHRLDHGEQRHVDVVQDVHGEEDPEDAAREEDDGEPERQVEREEDDGH